MAGTASALAVGGTTLQSPLLMQFPAITVGSGDYYSITLDPGAEFNSSEVVYLTAHNAADPTGTVLRSQEGSTQQNHPDGVAIEHAPTMYDFVNTFQSIVERDSLMPAGASSRSCWVNFGSCMRLYYDNGTRWVAWDEGRGYNPLDYGATGDGSTDDLAGFHACLGAMAASGVNKMIVSRPRAWYQVSSSIDLGYGNPLDITIEGESGYNRASAPGDTQFQKESAPQIRCASGAVFTYTGDRNNAHMIRRINGRGAAFFVDNSVFDNNIAGMRIDKCSFSGTATGLADNGGIIIKNGFWCEITDSAINSPGVSTTTTTSTTFPAVGTSFAISVVDATKFPQPANGVPEMACIGALNGFTWTDAVFSYTGKTANTLTGCTSYQTGSFATGTTVLWQSPWLDVRGGNFHGNSVSYLITVRDCLGSGQGVRYIQTDSTGGPVPAAFYFENINIESFYGASFDLYNAVAAAGTRMYLHDLHMINVTQEDSLCPGAINPVLQTSGPNTGGYWVYNATLDGCDHSFDGRSALIQMNVPNDITQLFLKNLNINTAVFTGNATAMANSSAVKFDGSGIVLLPNTSLRLVQGSGLTFEDASGVGVAGIAWHSGSPEGSQPAAPGSLCMDYTNGELYIKHTGTGNTGWKLVTHA